MSLNMIMNTATSGLMTAQGQLRVVSDNVSNVNTPGYVRKVAEQRAMTSQGMGAGVEIARMRLATDRFLQAASFNAGAEAARQGVRYELFDRIQSLFGNPSGGTDFFSQVDQMFSAFAVAAEDPISSPRRQEALFRAQSLFDEAARIHTQIQAVREDADGRIKSAVEGANMLLQQIEALNIEISRASVTGADASGAETRTVQADRRAVGTDGCPRYGPHPGRGQRPHIRRRAAGRGRVRHPGVSARRIGQQRERLLRNLGHRAARHQAVPRRDSITSGEIKGLLELRNVDAPAATERLAELVTQVADELNRAHNANSAVPAPASLTGRNVGQSFENAIAGFAGTTNIAVVDAAGVIQNQVEIVFSGGTMTVNGAAATPATFLAVLNAELGGAATASFAGGVLSLEAGAGNGVVVADDPDDPSRKTGRGFSHFFGLNDLVSTDRLALYDTGLTLTSPHGFTAGETLKLRFTGETGARLRDIEIAIPAGGTVDDLLTALNDSTTGVGYFGSFSLDASGALTFNPTRTPAPQLSVLEDRTTQVPSGVSLTELFGIGGGAGFAGGRLLDPRGYSPEPWPSRPGPTGPGRGAGNLGLVLGRRARRAAAGGRRRARRRFPGRRRSFGRLHLHLALRVGNVWRHRRQGVNRQGPAAKLRRGSTTRPPPARRRRKA